MTRIAASTILVALLISAAADAAPVPRAPQLPGYPLLVDQPGLRVYGPADGARTPCLRLLPLPAHAAAIVKQAVELAMPPFEHRLHLDGRDAVVTIEPTVSSGFSAAGGCGRTDWARSLFASIRLPHIAGASLAQHRFAVGRVRQGWVIWAYIH